MAARPKYPGPAPAVVIDLPDGSSVTVERGKQIPEEVPAKLADQLAKQWGVSEPRSSKAKGSKSKAAKPKSVAVSQPAEPAPVHVETTQPGTNVPEPVVITSTDQEEG